MAVRRFGDGWWDDQTYMLTSARGRIRLSGSEAWLLNYLWSRQVVRKQVILAAYGAGRRDPPGDKTLDVIAHRLRRKLNAVVPEVRVETIWGVGLRLIACRDKALRCPHCGALIERKNAPAAFEKN